MSFYFIEIRLEGSQQLRSSGMRYGHSDTVSNDEQYSFYIK